MNIFMSDVFMAISSFIGLIANVSILFLTIYTLYITAFSRKIKYISHSLGFSTFFGEAITITLMNPSLHAMPVQKVFVMTCKGKEFDYAKIFEDDDPAILDSHSVKKLSSKAFSAITDNNDSGKIIMDSDDLFENFVLGVVSGDKVVWIKPYKKAPLRKAKRAYKSENYNILTMSKRIVADRVVSDPVNLLIHLNEKDAFGQNHLRTIFAMRCIDDDEDTSILLSDSIRGYTAISGCGDTTKDIRKEISKTLGIDKNDIVIEELEERQL